MNYEHINLDVLSSPKKKQSHIMDCEDISLLEQQTLENTEGTIKHGQSKETGNIGHTRRRKTKQKHNSICVGYHYM